MVEHPSIPHVKVDNTLPKPTPPPKVDNTLPIPPKVDLPKLESNLEAAKKEAEHKKEILDKASDAAMKAHLDYSNSLKEISTCESALTAAKG